MNEAGSKSRTLAVQLTRIDTRARMQETDRRNLAWTCNGHNQHTKFYAEHYITLHYFTTPLIHLK